MGATPQVSYGRGRDLVLKEQFARVVCDEISSSYGFRYSAWAMCRR